jgi:DNA-binding NarL/FixJ family response regulator
LRTALKEIKILLIEDNRLLREGIAEMLRKQSDMHVAATVSNGENILNLLKKRKANIVLLDLGLRSRNSLKIVKSIVNNFQDVKVIIMDLIPLQSDVLDFVQAGVAGFILKDASISDFYKTIRSVHKGVKVLPQNLTGTLFSQIISNAISVSAPSVIADSVRMTKRERQVIGLIADGHTNKEIAKKLHLSIYTVKSHVHNILEKLALNTRVQIAKHAHLSKAYTTAIDTISLIDE